ncbi:hypothetical protein [Methylobacter sp. BBA5.1]|uniref:TlpA family protein disulfide reductase n=1 Tax=Methylobacter sp. BBA5.1 TaxID=1495064 RepID=UPI000568A421|nr:hypothetical protein [Methylobacter sp. BBA5.1]
MLLKKLLPSLPLILAIAFTPSARAEQPQLQPFASGSYQQILANNADHPFMLVIWSITCSSCLKDMELLNSLHKENPDLKMIMLAADTEDDTDQIQQILGKNQLTEIDNWVFADENAQKLRFEIDPKWYGELPRTYFFDASHQRTGISGVMSRADYETMFAKILK